MPSFAPPRHRRGGGVEGSDTLDIKITTNTVHDQPEEHPDSKTRSTSMNQQLYDDYADGDSEKSGSPLETKLDQ